MSFLARLTARFLALASIIAVFIVDIVVAARESAPNAVRWLAFSAAACVLWLSLPALADGGAAASAIDVGGLLDLFMTKVLPILVALGLFHSAAAMLRSLWAKVQVAAGKTPTKIDDFFVHLANPIIEQAIELVDAGDIEAAKKKLKGLQAAGKR